MGAKQSTTNYNNPPVQNNEYNQKENIVDNTDKITLDETFESLEDYKQSINNVYCLNKLIDEIN